MTTANPLPQAGPPPYFDVLFHRLQNNEQTTTTAFGRHVHWGYWDDPATADGSAEDYARAAEKLCHLVTDASGVRSSQRLLDVGCGFGGTIASLNERFERMDFTGVNIDGRQLERARETITPLHGNRMRYIQGDACNLPIQGETFDVVTAVECIFHFPSRAAFFAHAARVLKPGCRLALSDFVPRSDAQEMLQAVGAGGDEATVATYGHIDVSCPIEEYEAMGRAVGLHLVHDQDCTLNVLPTYPFLRASMKDWPDARHARQFDQATAQLEWACKKALITYRILAFERR
jgi:SAM-dependent methyltransferase